MRTYLALYLESMKRLKEVESRHDFSPAGEKQFEKALNRAHRLNKKVKSEETVYELTPDARALVKGWSS